jgi:tetratricopeptide (TPR) repeat protein
LQDQPEAAIASLSRAAALSGPTNDAPRLRLARALVELGRFAEATNQLASLLAPNPGHPAARLELVRVRLALHQLAGASELLAPCLTNPYTARAGLLLLSQIKAREGETGVAASLAQRAAAMPKPFDWPDPFLREVQSLRGDRTRGADQINALLLQQRLPEAEAALTRFLQSAPEDVEGLLLLGRLRLQQKRCAEAADILERHLVLRPESLNGLVQLGMARYCESRWPEAAEAFTRAVALKPDFAQAHHNLGLALARAGNSDRAIASFREAIRCAPGDAGPWVALAEEHLRLGQIADAHICLARIEKIQGNHPALSALRQRIQNVP